LLFSPDPSTPISDRSPIPAEPPGLCTLGALCTARCRHCSPPTDTNFQAGKPAPPPYPADPSSAFFGNSLPRRLNFTSALFITDTAFCSAVRRPANLQISDPHLRCERSSVHLISCWFLPVHRNFIRRHAAAVSLMQGLMSPSWPVRSVSHARGHKNPKTVLIAPPRPAPAADRTPASGPHAAANCVKRSTSRAPLIQTAKFSELSVRSRVSGSASPDVPQTPTWGSSLRWTATRRPPALNTSSCPRRATRTTRVATVAKTVVPSRQPSQNV
jgi:hypothetical protein